MGNTSSMYGTLYSTSAPAPGPPLPGTQQSIVLDAGHALEVIYTPTTAESTVVATRFFRLCVTAGVGMEEVCGTHALLRQEFTTGPAVGSQTAVSGVGATVTSFENAAQVCVACCCQRLHFYQSISSFSFCNYPHACLCCVASLYF